MSWARKSKWLLLLVVGIASALAFAFCRPKAPDPVYKDIRLSEWLQLYHVHITHTYGLPMFPGQPGQALKPREHEAEDALINIGTNAVPMLMQWLTARPNPFEKLALRCFGSSKYVPRSWRSQLAGSVYNHGHLKNLIAFNVLKTLGPLAVPAIPQLEEMASRSTADDDATHLLMSIGPAAVPSLANALRKNNNSVRRVEILNALGTIGSPASGVVSNVVVCLQDMDSNVAGAAAETLGRIQRHPEIAVPALILAIQQPPLVVQKKAIVAVGAFGSLASDAEAVLITARENVVLFQRAEAALKNIREPVAAGGSEFSLDTEFTPVE